MIHIETDDFLDNEVNEFVRECQAIEVLQLARLQQDIITEIYTLEG